jgi:hypothetical protein
MKLADAASIGTLISSIAVAISLVYLTFQIRQSAKHQRGAISHGRAQQFQNRISSVCASPELMETILRGWAGDPTLGAIQSNQFYWFVFSIFVMFEDIHHQFEQGMIGRPTYQSAVRTMRRQLSLRGSRAAWLIARESFEDRFVAFVDDLAREHPSDQTGDHHATWKALVAQSSAARDVA